jgi:hypothetical protein
MNLKLKKKGIRLLNNIKYMTTTRKQIISIFILLPCGKLKECMEEIKSIIVRYRNATHLQYADILLLLPTLINVFSAIYFIYH